MSTATGETDGQLERRWLEADPEGETRRLKLLRQIRSSGQLSSDDRDLRGVVLAREDLTGVNLSRCDLSGVDLSGAKLDEANLSWANLQGANPFRAQLNGAELLSANLSGANLTEVQAERAGFGRANLNESVFLSARLTEATFSAANLSHTDLRAADLQKARLREADLTHANLAAARLRMADFQNSQVAEADFSDSDLREAHLKGIQGFVRANWLGADIRNVDFCGAYMVRRHIMDENYLSEFRRQNRLTEFLYQLWWLTSDRRLVTTASGFGRQLRDGRRRPRLLRHDCILPRPRRVSPLRFCRTWRYPCWL